MNESTPATGRAHYTQLEYEAVLANASIGIAITRDRKFFLANPQFEEMFGWPRGELIGQSGEVVYPSNESYAALGQIAIPILSTGKKLDIEWEARRKDGSTFLARMIAKAIDPRNPSSGGTVWIVEDITERRRHADEVDRLLREQQALLGTAQVGIVFLRERQVVRCNRRYEEIYGYGPGELDGQPTKILHVDQAAHTALDEGYARLARGSTHRETQVRRRKDGSVIWVRLDGRAVDSNDPAKGSVWTAEDVTEQRRVEAEMQQLLAEQRALLNNVAVGIAFVRDRVIERCNQRYEELFGYAPGEVIGRPTSDFYFTPDAASTAAQSYAEIDRSGVHQREEYLRREDGSGFWCRLSGRALEPGDPSKGYVWLFEDVSERRVAEEQVRRALAEQELILSNATIGISFVPHRTFQRCNPRLEEMFGYAPGEMLGQSTRIIFPDDATFEEIGREAIAVLGEGKTYSYERALRCKDGSPLWCKVLLRAIDYRNPLEGAIAIFDDITAERESREVLERAVAERTAELKTANEQLETEIRERRQAEARALHIADHDSLTGLPNRRLLEDRLTQALALSKRNRKLTAAVFVDLDRFKNINDTLGHAVGDAVLKEIADRLVAQLRVGDTVCRLGGDEFLVVLPEIARASDAARVAQKAIDNLSAPIRIGGREIAVTPSIGIAVYPDDGADAQTLLKNADAAMYHVKDTGRGHYQFFTETMNRAAADRLALEGELLKALREGDLRVHVQPVVELATGAAVGHEALLRWQHPKRGLIPAAEFVQLAEDTGAILPIGEWVLEEACRWAVGAPQAGRVLVNVSARQFVDPRLVDIVANTLGQTGLPGTRLALELAEKTLSQCSETALVVLPKLKALGVSIVIDDFGMGASRLALLRQYPLDAVKIDGGIVSDMTRSGDQQAVASSIIALAHALGLRVVAECVETEAQRELLRERGCDDIQGYLIGRPEAIKPIKKDKKVKKGSDPCG